MANNAMRSSLLWDGVIPLPRGLEESKRIHPSFPSYELVNNTIIFVSSSSNKVN
ncbi:hypothetical protein Lalb_Chr15g0081091 [Lupinus albus]|uniref:Uncharacterized protein n=1 Tax=Lupinus albus TaxID=3870 RepID=A0A6A4PDG9_LUPAL|nr:hypothetical protein Lalb_Chr15g0081091 [Lupinus albus]